MKEQIEREMAWIDDLAARVRREADEDHAHRTVNTPSEQP